MPKLTLWAVLALLLPGLAFADCAGEDLLARLASERPAAYAEVLAEAEATQNGEARYWRVEAPGGGAPSYLFGTYHDTEALQTVPAAVLAQLDASRLLLVELTADEAERMEARIAVDPSFSFDLDAKGMAARLTREERALAEEVLRDRGLTLEVAARLKPWLLFALLGVPACQLQEISAGGQVLDELLVERARAEGIPVRGLETFEDGLGAFDAIPESAALELARDMLRLAPMEEDIRRTMVELYADGRIGMVGAFSAWIAEDVSGRRSAEAERLTQALERTLLVKRNRAWMMRMASEMRRGGVFAAVGALHLPGEAGLVALLRARGFTVEPASER